MTRSELFGIVWKEPLAALAPKLGMSKPTLLKLCRMHNVPVPGRGHWAKVKAGQAVAPRPIDQPESDPEVRLPAGRGASETDSAPKDLSAKAVPGRGAGASPEQTSDITWPFPGGSPSESDDANVAKASRSQSMAANHFDMARALDAEVDRAVAAGIDLQRRQAVDGLLNEVALRALEMDPASCRLLLSWARTVCQRLDESDPVSGVIAAVKLAAIDGATSQWRL